MTTMTFTRESTKTGRQDRQKMPFTTPERALEWVTIINRKAALGQSNFLVVEFILAPAQS